MKKIYGFFHGIAFIFIYMIEMMRIMNARAKSEDIQKEYEKTLK